MRKIAFLLALAPGLALAQVSASFRIDLPLVLPQLVVVQPGIQVVPDVDAEVFYTGGYYWVRGDDDRWYRSHDHRGGWVYVERRHVPPGLVRIPPGQYRRWHGRPAAYPVGPRYRGAPAPAYRGAPGPAFREERHERREDRRERWEGDEHEDRGHGHGNGRGKHDRD